MVMAMVSNSGQTAIGNIQQQFDRISCPMPAFSGLWNDTSTVASGVLNYTGKTYNYPNVSNQTLTLTCTDFHTADGQDYDMGCPACVGWVVFIPDWFASLTDHILGVFTIIAFMLSPINFDVLGYTIDDLSGLSLMFVIGLYIFAYIPIGIFLYKALSPFTGL